MDLLEEPSEMDSRPSRAVYISRSFLVGAYMSRPSGIAEVCISRHFWSGSTSRCPEAGLLFDAFYAGPDLEARQRFADIHTARLAVSEAILAVSNQS